MITNAVLSSISSLAGVSPLGGSVTHHSPVQAGNVPCTLAPRRERHSETPTGPQDEYDAELIVRQYELVGLPSIVRRTRLVVRSKGNPDAPARSFEVVDVDTYEHGTLSCQRFKLREVTA